MCITDEVLRAKLDNELNSEQLREVATHLTACASCRERAEYIASQAKAVGDELQALAPRPGEAEADAAMALSRFKAHQRRSEEKSPSMFGHPGAWLRPAYAALAAIAIVALLSLAPARSWGQRFLAMLRVQNITVVPVDVSALAGPNGETAAGKMLGKMISDNVVVTIHSSPQDVSSVSEASHLAGFAVRLPSERVDAPQLTVAGEQAFQMTVDRDRAQSILDDLGRSDLTLPLSLQGATIAVHIPPAVVARYGHCPKESDKSTQGPPNFEQSGATDCVVVAQVPSPTVSVPPDLNLAQLAEAGLQALGWSAADAHDFCQTVDWTSTLVIPLPRDVNSYQTVDVDEVKGTLINVPAEWKRPAGYALMWVKNGIIYSVAGTGDSADAVTLADSMD